MSVDRRYADQRIYAINYFFADIDLLYNLSAKVLARTEVFLRSSSLIVSEKLSQIRPKTCKKAHR